MKQLHEYAKFFPPMEGEEFDALCKDVKAHGLMNPIILYDDKILDGRNRAKACEKIGIKPAYEEFKNGNALEFVISQNVLRRHLTTSQRQVLALELEERFAKEIKLSPKQRATAGSKSPEKRADRDRSNSAASRAAKALHVGRSGVEDVKRLKRDAPHLIPAIRAGKLSVTEAKIQHRNNRAEEWARKEGERAKREHLQKHNRQVGDFLEATKVFIVALKVANVGIERFSAPEAVTFTKRRLNEIRKLMDELEGGLK